MFSSCTKDWTGDLRPETRISRFRVSHCVRVFTASPSIHRYLVRNDAIQVVCWRSRYRMGALLWEMSVISVRAACKILMARYVFKCASQSLSDNHHVTVRAWRTEGKLTLVNSNSLPTTLTPSSQKKTHTKDKDPVICPI